MQFNDLKKKGDSCFFHRTALFWECETKNVYIAQFYKAHLPPLRATPMIKK